ncbi:hypothetical protein M011DRAFT_471320 [Sporormia fimetaria CBS 119925]|uniref:BZIP transcription factor n=1 Tax=Sporormia fimetaria CBS 119925 TaxID=1340428 RepID=A0A6A6V1H1_9PLEO|nr:hypothetical protein M011DRAFT_471320 [Sporormia fimetaria CBS 119925]
MVGPEPDQSDTTGGRSVSQPSQPSPATHDQKPPDAPEASHSHSPAAPATAGAKRRRTGPSSRGVANLTPEQLARKRQNDREAQRAIRERTKNQIDALNRRIQELESQQPYHDLQLVVREKEAVQAENTDIKTRLQNVLTIIEPLVRGKRSGLNELAAAAERSPLPVPPTRDSGIRPSEPRPMPIVVPDVPFPQNGVHSPAPTVSSRQWAYAPETQPRHVRQWSGEHPTPYDQQPRPSVAPEMPFDERLGVNFLLDDGQRRAEAHDGLHLPPARPRTPPPLGQLAPILIPHLIIPRTIEPTCPLDSILLKYLADAHYQATEGGIPLDALSGPPYPDFTALVYKDRPLKSHHPLSKLFTDIIRTFPDVSGLPEQVAVVYIMYLIMRWQIEPTQENYERMPDWVTPRPSQLFVPHPYWFSHLPWPGLRDRLISTRPFTPFDAFFIPFTTSLSLNWPYDPHSCLLRASTPSLLATGQPNPNGDEERWIMNPEFEAHLRDLGNWSLGSVFRSALPRFADTVRIRER